MLAIPYISHMEGSNIRWSYAAAVFLSLSEWVQGVRMDCKYDWVPTTLPGFALKLRPTQGEFDCESCGGYISWEAGGVVCKRCGSLYCCRDECIPGGDAEVAPDFCPRCNGE